jgi:hypothetical protein
VPEIENRPRLELKTKVFRSPRGNDGNPTNTEGAAAATAASGATENNNIDNSESNATSSGWSLPQLHLPTFGTNVRESTTLEEMDDEMEHGERCAICLLRLEDGDVVGDLPCSHVLHKVSTDLLVYVCAMDF